MAGDWIKLEMTTPDKPEVVRIASLLRMDQDAALGKLIRIWVWADQNSIAGDNVAVTEAFLDRLTNKRGFAAAMRTVNWLEGQDGALVFPGFHRHNGKTAKARAETNRRVADHRDRERNAAVEPSPEDSKRGGNVNVTHEALPIPLPEKRREDEIPPNPHDPGGGDHLDHIPSTVTPFAVHSAPRQAYPDVLRASPAFVSCWEDKWLPYLVQRKGGRSPAIMTLEKQLQTCARLGPAKAIGALESAIEKEWAAPDVDAKAPQGGGSGRPWDDAPDDWKAYWRETYSPEDFPDAPRYEDGQWDEVPPDHRKMIWEALNKRRRKSA